MMSALDTLDNCTGTCVFLGVVANKLDLPETSEVGSIYHSSSENAEFIFDGEGWVEFGSCSDVTKETTNDKVEVFKCPNCGGNQIEQHNGLRRCAFCGSAIL